MIGCYMARRLAAFVLLVSTAQLCLKVGSARKSRKNVLYSVFDPFTLCGYGLISFGNVRGRLRHAIFGI